jgi:hypothetical protein
MEQTLIVSSLARGVTLRCTKSAQQISVRLETTHTALGCVQWNFFPVPDGVWVNHDRRNTWLRNQQMNLGRLFLDLQRQRFSKRDVEKVLAFVTGVLVEWGDYLDEEVRLPRREIY